MYYRRVDANASAPIYAATTPPNVMKYKSSNEPIAVSLSASIPNAIQEPVPIIATREMMAIFLWVASLFLNISNSYSSIFPSPSKSIFSEISDIFFSL